MKTIIGYRDFGHVSLQLKKIMDEKGISISKMVKLSALNHNIVKRYYNNEASRYDSEILAKFCYILECEIDDLLGYELAKDNKATECSNYYERIKLKAI